jgi:UDP-N-acetylglucosamine 2-epimerase (non-hydrolysing)
MSTLTERVRPAKLRSLPVTDRGTVAYLVGARPNFVKMAPLIAEMRRRGPDFGHVLINTGQHYDPEMAEIFIDELQMGAPDYQLEVGSGPHGAQTGKALERIEAVLDRLRPRAFVVSGDVNSTLAGALAAAKLGIPIAHLEAGLRSFDRSMPEEINRVVTDQLSEWCLTHSPEAKDNLIQEGISPDRVFFVGNTMIDTLVRMRPAIESSPVLERLSLRRRAYILVTLHRPALVDGGDFGRVLAGLARLADWAPVVFPVHPRTRARLDPAVAHPRLHFVEPVGYVDFLALETGALAVLTDSGGIQEESTFLGVPCFTMRSGTERPVTVSHGTNRIIGTDPTAIDGIPAMLDGWSAPAAGLEGWDGHASERAADILLAALHSGLSAPATSGRTP